MNRNLLILFYYNNMYNNLLENFITLVTFILFLIFYEFVIFCSLYKSKELIEAINKVYTFIETKDKLLQIVIIFLWIILYTILYKGGYLTYMRICSFIMVTSTILIYTRIIRLLYIYYVIEIYKKVKDEIIGDREKNKKIFNFINKYIKILIIIDIIKSPIFVFIYYLELTIQYVFRHIVNYYLRKYFKLRVFLYIILIKYGLDVLRFLLYKFYELLYKWSWYDIKTLLTRRFEGLLLSILILTDIYGYIVTYYNVKLIIITIYIVCGICINVGLIKKPTNIDTIIDLRNTCIIIPVIIDAYIYYAKKNKIKEIYKLRSIKNLYITMGAEISESLLEIEYIKGFSNFKRKQYYLDYELRYNYILTVNLNYKKLYVAYNLFVSEYGNFFIYGLDEVIAYKHFNNHMSGKNGIVSKRIKTFTEMVEQYHILILYLIWDFEYCLGLYENSTIGLDSIIGLLRVNEGSQVYKKKWSHREGFYGWGIRAIDRGQGNWRVEPTIGLLENISNFFEANIAYRGNKGLNNSVISLYSLFDNNAKYYKHLALLLDKMKKEKYYYEETLWELETMKSARTELSTELDYIYVGRYLFSFLQSHRRQWLILKENQDCEIYHWSNLVLLETKYNNLLGEQEQKDANNFVKSKVL